MKLNYQKKLANMIVSKCLRKRLLIEKYELYNGFSLLSDVTSLPGILTYLMLSILNICVAAIVKSVFFPFTLISKRPISSIGKNDCLKESACSFIDYFF